MTAYLVTTGDGSDGDEWHVHGIFSSRELAQPLYDKITALRTRPDGSTFRHDADIEEWLIDPKDLPDPMP